MNSRFVLPGRIAAAVLASALLCWIPIVASAEQADGNWLEDWWQQPFGVEARVYGWLPEAPASISVNGEQEAFLPESLDTILDSANMLFMGEFKVSKGRIGLFADVIYYDGTDNTSFTGPLGVERKLQVKERVWLVEYGAGFDLVTFDLGEAGDSPSLTLSPYAGFRYFHDPIQVSSPAGPIFEGVNLKRTVEFNTPIIGAEAELKLSDRWTVNVGGDYGVLNDNEVDQTWQYIGILKYLFEFKGQSSEVFVGYRKFHLELEKDVTEDLDIDLEMKGPVIGVGLSW